MRSHVSDDNRVSIDAKGYAGSAYWGRFFWDTEIFMLPFFIYTAPDKARNLLEFRIRNLQAACKNASYYGYKGAKYPWESDNLGNECCPNWQFRDHQVHVNADIIYALVHYANATNNLEFLSQTASYVLVETARYWLERVDKRMADVYYSLLGVMGPDEYKPLTNNNSYTNKIVSFALKMAAKYGQFGGANFDEIERFKQIAASLPVIRKHDGLVLQCEGFENFADPQFAKLWRDRSKPFAQFVSQERIYRSKCLKQADVLLMMILFYEDFSEEEIKSALDYYLPLTTHDSSLSKGCYALVSAKAGLTDIAWELWKECCDIDMNIKKKGASDGIHIANSGLMWQVIVFGFAGLASAVHSDKMKFKPCLLGDIKKIIFPFVWKGIPAKVRITQKDLTIWNCSNTESLDVVVNDCGYLLNANTHSTINI